MLMYGSEAWSVTKSFDTWSLCKILQITVYYSSAYIVVRATS